MPIGAMPNGAPTRARRASLLRSRRHVDEHAREEAELLECGRLSSSDASVSTAPAT